MQSSSDAIVSRDVTGAITGWNDAATWLFEYEPLEALGQTLAVIAPDEALVADQALFERVLAGERVETYPTERRQKGGATIEVSATLSPVHGSGNEIVGVASIERDITSARATERERDVLIADLKRSNTDLEQFAYVASHDLSEPLRAVAGMVDLLAKRYEGELDETAQDYINRAVAGTQRMQALITDLLVYSRAGRGDLDFQECDTDALFRTTIDILGPAIRESGAKVYVETLPKVAADPLKLGQVFQNLVANAIKFAGDDPPRVVASAARSGVGWTFSVRDHGIGIESRHRERVFKIFNRLHGWDEYPGTGIGLALCKRLVEAHGGAIRVGEVEAEGTLLQFTIPDREAGS